MELLFKVFDSFNTELLEKIKRIELDNLGKDAAINEVNMAREFVNGCSKVDSMTPSVSKTCCVRRSVFLPYIFAKISASVFFRQAPAA